MSGFELKPLSLGELLDRAFLLYRRNFALFIGIMVIPACIVVPARFFYLKGQGVAIPWEKPAPQPHVAAYGFIFIFLDFIIYALAQAATTFAVADVYLGRVSTVQTAYRKIRGRFWRIMGVTLNVGIRVFGLMFVLGVGAAIAAGAATYTLSRGSVPQPALVIGALAMIVAGFGLAIAFSVRYALTLPAVLLEDIKGSAAIRRSVHLSEGRRGQIFLAILLGVVVLYSMAIVFQGPFYAGIALTRIQGHVPVWMILAMSVSATIGGAIAGPLLMILLVLCYYDSRIRKEAFDLHQMVASLPEPAPGAASPSFT